MTRSGTAEALAADPIASPAMIEIQGLSVTYSRSGLLSARENAVRAVSDVSLRIPRGTSLGLVGESGCGKSTLGRAILRAAPISSGRIVFDGTDITTLEGAELRRIRARMQMVFQDPYSSLDPRMSVERIVAEPLLTHSHANAKARRARVAEVLGTVGIDPARMNERPGAFSGGQRQRICIARALVMNPDFILCDEATSALDVSIRAQILNLLQDLRAEQGLTYMMISHDLGSLRQLCERIAVMYLGRIVELGETARVLFRPTHPYTRSLISAIPLPDPEKERARSRIVLRGDVPSPLRLPSGCGFHTRCWLRDRLGRPARCSEEPPELRAMSDGSSVACHFAEDASSPESSATAPKGA